MSNQIVSSFIYLDILKFVSFFCVFVNLFTYVYLFMSTVKCLLYCIGLVVV